jgi:hypothetical protein
MRFLKKVGNLNLRKRPEVFQSSLDAFLTGEKLANDREEVKVYFNVNPSTPRPKGQGLLSQPAAGGVDPFDFAQGKL